MKEKPSKTIHRHFSTSVHNLKSVNQYRKVQTIIWMVEMHTSTLVTSIYSLLLKEISWFIKPEGNALNAARSTLYSSVHSLKSVNQYRKVQTFIGMVEMHTLTFVTTNSIISLKGFCRFIKHKRNALKDATSTLFKICLYLEKCISIQKILNFCMDGKNAYLDTCDLNLYFIT